MSLFTKKEKVYEAKGKKEEWKQVKAALKEAGISGVSSSVWQDEPPVCGCGAKLDVRDFGPNGKIDRDVYSIRVNASDAGKASSVIHGLLPDYTPYVSRTAAKDSADSRKGSS